MIQPPMLVDKPAPGGLVCCYGHPAEWDLNPPWPEGGLGKVKPCREKATRSLATIESPDAPDFHEVAHHLCRLHAEWWVERLPPKYHQRGVGVRSPTYRRDRARSMARQHREQLPPPSERRRIRVAAELSQGQVGARLGVDKGTVSRWEDGLNEPTEPTRGLYLDLLKEMRRRSDEGE